MIETFIVDAFTNQVFKGNPAGVCFLKEDIETQKMQLIAKELGLSETAFIIEEGGLFNIRYFSPKMEIPLCGHATMASSKVLFEKDSSLQKIHFVNIEGLDLLIKKENHQITMEFPIYDLHPAEAPTELLKALGIESIINSTYNKETEILMLEVAETFDIEAMQPDFEALYKSHKSINGVLITGLSSRNEFDYECRYFWPWSGTNEDPVTGAIQTFMAKYWADKLQKKNLRSLQCSERSGTMDLEIKPDNKVILKSDARIVLQGALRI